MAQNQIIHCKAKACNNPIKGCSYCCANKMSPKDRQIFCKTRASRGQALECKFCVPHIQRVYRTGSAGGPIKNSKSGISFTPEYVAWKSMIQRCTNRNNIAFKWYGARGIRVSKQWMKPEKFLMDMGKRPSSKHSLDRIDNSKGYSSGNCRWATKSEQAYNRRLPGKQ